MAKEKKREKGRGRRRWAKIGRGLLRLLPIIPSLRPIVQEFPKADKTFERVAAIQGLYAKQKTFRRRVSAALRRPGEPGDVVLQITRREAEGLRAMLDAIAETQKKP